MARLIHVTPFFEVLDLEGMIAFFTNGLGFEALVQRWDYSYLQRDGAGFRLLLTKGPSRPAKAYVDVQDVDGLYAEFASRLEPTVMRNNPKGPRDQVYEQREFTVFAPEGHTLFFGQAISPAKEPDAS